MSGQFEYHIPLTTEIDSGVIIWQHESHIVELSLQWPGARHPKGWSHCQPPWNCEWTACPRRMSTQRKTDWNDGEQLWWSCLSPQDQTMPEARFYWTFPLLKALRIGCCVTCNWKSSYYQWHTRCPQSTLGTGIRRVGYKEFKNNNRTHYESICFLLLPFTGNFKPYQNIPPSTVFLLVKFLNNHYSSS